MAGERGDLLAHSRTWGFPRLAPVCDVLTVFGSCIAPDVALEVLHVPNQGSWFQGEQG